MRRDLTKTHSLILFGPLVPKEFRFYVEIFCVSRLSAHVYIGEVREVKKDILLKRLIWKDGACRCGVMQEFQGVHHAEANEKSVDHRRPHSDGCDRDHA